MPYGKFEKKSDILLYDEDEFITLKYINADVSKLSMFSDDFLFKCFVLRCKLTQIAIDFNDLNRSNGCEFVLFDALDGF